jgi:transcriptional regulator with XRE-family HTH domain
VAEDPWRRQIEAFGAFIHTQRKLARLTLRELAARTEVSNAYLSQLERGLHTPSLRVVRQLADAFNISAETMLERAGLLSDEDVPAPDVEGAIKSDPKLTAEQKEALLAVYHGFTNGRSGV